MDVLRLKVGQIDEVEELSDTLADLSFVALNALLADAQRMADGADGGLRSLARVLTADTNHLLQRSEES